MGQKKGQVEKLVSRRKSKKGVEYEVQRVGCKDPMYDNEWVVREVPNALTSLPTAPYI